jgi:hypothetical protein
MGNIYHNSYCTISASMAGTGEIGCFMNRRPLQAHLQARTPTRRVQANRLSDHDIDRLTSSHDLSKVDGRLIGTALQKRLSRNPRSKLLHRRRRELQHSPIRRGHPLSLAEMTIRPFQTDLWASEVDASPLSRRAWTLQERILSARILHFGKTQLYWECQASKASETWPRPAYKTMIDKSPPPREFKLLSNRFSHSNRALRGVVIYPLTTTGTTLSSSTPMPISREPKTNWWLYLPLQNKS